jgi:hypothetical protein
MRLCALSVDLDEIHLYHRIHGLPAPHPLRANVVYDLALGRWLEFARRHELPLTLFVVGSDALRPENARQLLRAAELGHEIGSHSKDHLYDLTRRPADEQREQVEGALEILQVTLGARPRGFRAPGYTVTDELLGIVAQAGHTYDSSVFPCPAYYAAKAAAFAALAARGRRSESILDTPRVLAAPTRPYRVGTPYYRRRTDAADDGPGLLELPIQVTPGARLPYIGTGLILAGRVGARLLTAMVIGEPFVNLELHGIDLLGKDDGLGELLGAYQPDARLALAKKQRALDEVVSALRAADYRFVTLAEATRFA